MTTTADPAASPVAGPGTLSADLAPPPGDVDERAVVTIRLLAADAVQAAGSGHPGLPMGAAAPAYVLWSRFLRHDPACPGWPDRDRFVLSAGHGSMLPYALAHLSGYDLPMGELRAFRQWGSATPGHPEYRRAHPHRIRLVGPPGHPSGTRPAAGRRRARAHQGPARLYPGHVRAVARDVTGRLRKHGTP